MATIGSLIVNLIANTSVFDTKLESSKTGLKGFVASIATTQKAMLNLAQGVVAAAGMAGLTYYIKKTMDSIEATAKLSDRLNMSTEDLVSMQYAAQQSGMGVEDMNTFLEVFIRKIGEASTGSGSATKTFRELGISVRELANNDSTENLKLIADRINQLPNAAERAAVAYDLFGKKGQGMLNLLAGGSSGIEAFRQEADKLGITFSRLDAAQVEAANDAINRAKTSVTGLAQVFAIEMAPSIAAAADKLTEFATSGENMREKMLSTLKDVTWGFALVGNMVNVVSAAIKFMAGMLLGEATLVLTVFDTLLHGIEEIYNKIVVLQNKLADTKVGVKLDINKMEAADLTSGIDGEIAGLAIETGKLFKGAFTDITDLPTMKVDAWFDDLEKRSKAVENNLAQRTAQNKAMAGTAPLQISGGAEKIKESLDALDLEYSMLGKTNTERERAVELSKFQRMVADEYVGDLDKQNELMQTYADKLDAITAGKRGVAAFQEKLGEWAEDSTNVWKNLGEVGVNAFNNIGDALTNMVMTGKMDWKTLANTIIGDLIHILIMMQMARIASAIGLTTLFAAGTGAAGAGAGEAGAEGMVGDVPVWHTGGLVGSAGTTRSVYPTIFAGASRMHSGGFAGDEVPAILQTGEYVLSRKQLSNMNHQQQSSEKPVIVIKAWDVSDIQRNSKAIEGIIGDAMRRRTPLRESLRQYG